MFSKLLEPFANLVLGIWEILCWLASAWFDFIYLGFAAIGWLVVIAGAYLVIAGPWTTGGAVFFLGLLFLAGSQLFKLLAFWLSDEKYVMAPQAFASDIVGTVIGFFMFFGILFGIWYFAIYEKWFFVILVALMPIMIINSLSRFARNFLAMVKAKMSVGKK